MPRHCHPTYDFDDGELMVESGSVGAEQTAACWVVTAQHSRYAYVVNTGSGTVTGFKLARNGELARLTANGITGVTGGAPTDAATDSDGDTLYVLHPAAPPTVGSVGVILLAVAPPAGGRNEARTLLLVLSSRTATALLCVFDHYRIHRLPLREHRSQQLFSKGVLDACSRLFGILPDGCDPVRSASQSGSGRINRLSHWTTPP